MNYKTTKTIQFRNVSKLMRFMLIKQQCIFIFLSTATVRQYLKITLFFCKLSRVILKDIRYVLY